MNGPPSPHVRVLSSDSNPSLLHSSVDVDLLYQKSPLNTTFPLHASPYLLEPKCKDTPVPTSRFSFESRRHFSAADGSVSTSSNFEVTSWTPEDVVSWMKSINIDAGIIEIFFVNDISGSILLQLQPEDLKELNIQSFGKRHTLMNSIRQLRDNATISNRSQTSQADVSQPTNFSADNPTSSRATTPSSCNSNSSTLSKEDVSESSVRSHRRHRHRRHRHSQFVKLEDMPSIVAIEQVLPRLHSCSKGERCRKRQKQQARMQHLAKDLPTEIACGRAIVTGDPGNPATAPNLLKQPSDFPLSADDIKSDNAVDRRLSEGKLTGLQPIDPQENVRQFVDGQRLSILQPADYPLTPPIEDFSKIPADSLRENLRSLPKLQIPDTAKDAVVVPDLSAPGTLSSSNVRIDGSFDLVPPQYATYDAALETQHSAYGPAPSPSDFYRQDPSYGLASAYPETDIPEVGIPFMDYNPVARETSQSVPPNMQYGGNNTPKVTQGSYQHASRKMENHCDNLPQNHVALRPTYRCATPPPIETPEDLQGTHRAAGYRNFPSAFGNHDLNHSGWMKKRRTRLLRHEWNEHHFTLRGTQLAMYADEQASHRDSKALEYVDVDDYAVACSSVASNSKLTAAFKKAILKRRDNMNEQAAFGFSLVPSPNHVNSFIEKKVLPHNSGKAHHFAVKTRDERIDWMREIMMAKALKRGKGNGEAVQVNGTPV